MLKTYFLDPLLKTEWLFPLDCLRSYRDDIFARQAERLSQIFQREPRQDPVSAQSNPQVLEGRYFFKDLPQIADSRIDRCRQEHLALKLGITSEIFTHNPGFEKFATDSHLERYLVEYHHKLGVSPSSWSLSILSNGQFISWEKASTLLKSFPQHTGAPLLPWVYGPEGLQSDDMYDWSKLKPYKRSDASEWGYQYLFELVVCCGSTPHKRGDHGWLRLRTPEGAIYSVGLYRPGKRSLSDNWTLPFRLKRGHLMMPDVSEFWPGENRSLKVAITQWQFETMVARIEQEKAQDMLIFQLFHANCVLWAKHIATIAGIDLPDTDDSVARILTPRCIEPIVDFCCSYVPQTVKRLAEIPLAIGINSLQLALGAGSVDAAVIQRNGPHVHPHISCFFDIFRPSKMYLHHPYTFGNETLRRVEEWRKNKRAQAEQEFSISHNSSALSAQISFIEYAIPGHPPKSAFNTNKAAV